MRTIIAIAITVACMAAPELPAASAPLQPPSDPHPPASGPDPQVSGLRSHPSPSPSEAQVSGFIPPPSPAPGGAPGSAFATMSTLDDVHPLDRGDKLSFRILEDQDDPKEPMEPRPLIVGDHGDVEVPYIGRFPAEGKTCKQLAGEIKIELEKKYYYHATVIIGLDLLAKTTGKVYVVGEVRLTGPVEMPGDESLTVGTAILRAGGFTNYADKRNVRVTRKSRNLTPSTQVSGLSSQPSEANTFTVNVSEVLEKGKADKDLILQPGDLIYVPTRLINF